MVEEKYRKEKYTKEDANFKNDLPRERKDLFIPGQIVPVLHREQYIINSGRIRDPHLDVGCHQGRLVIRLAQMGYNVYGIDAARFAVEIVNRNAKHMGLTTLVGACHGLAQDLPWEDGQFGSITCCETLEHCEHKEAIQEAINEMWRVLEPGGWLIFTVPIGMEHVSKNHFFHWFNEEDVVKDLIHRGSGDVGVFKISSGEKDFIRKHKTVFYIEQRKPE